MDITGSEEVEYEDSVKTARHVVWKRHRALSV